MQDIHKRRLAHSFDFNKEDSFRRFGFLESQPLSACLQQTDNTSTSEFTSDESMTKYLLNVQNESRLRISEGSNRYGTFTKMESDTPFQVNVYKPLTTEESTALSTVNEAVNDASKPFSVYEHGILLAFRLLGYLESNAEFDLREAPSKFLSGIEEKIFASLKLERDVSNPCLVHQFTSLSILQPRVFGAMLNYVIESYKITCKPLSIGSIPILFGYFKTKDPVTRNQGLLDSFREACDFFVQAIRAGSQSEGVSGQLFSNAIKLFQDHYSGKLVERCIKHMWGDHELYNSETNFFYKATRGKRKKLAGSNTVLVPLSEDLQDRIKLAMNSNDFKDAVLRCELKLLHGEELSAEDKEQLGCVKEIVEDIAEQWGSQDQQDSSETPLKKQRRRYRRGVPNFNDTEYLKPLQQEKFTVNAETLEDFATKLSLEEDQIAAFIRDNDLTLIASIFLELKRVW